MLSISVCHSSVDEGGGGEGAVEVAKAGTEESAKSHGSLNPPTSPFASFGKSFHHLYIHPNCPQSSHSTCCHRVLNTAGQRIKGILNILIPSRERFWQVNLYKRKSHKNNSQAPFPPVLFNSLFYSINPNVMKFSKFWMLEYPNYPLILQMSPGR